MYIVIHVHEALQARPKIARHLSGIPRTLDASLI